MGQCGFGKPPCNGGHYDPNDNWYGTREEIEVPECKHERTETRTTPYLVEVTVCTDCHVELSRKY